MHDTHTLRLFLGFPVPEAMFSLIVGYMNQIQPDIKGFRWTKHENLHLTVLFLGNTPGHQLPEIKKTIHQITSKMKSFSLDYLNTGYAPPGKNKSMIWTNFQKHPVFGGLVSDLAMNLLNKKQKGEPLPHITLARFKGQELVHLPNLELPALYCTQVNLWASELTPKGPIYSVLSAYTFDV